MSGAKSSQTQTLRMVLDHQGDRVEVKWRIPGRAEGPEKPEPGQPGHEWIGYYVSAIKLERLGKEVSGLLERLQGVDWDVADRAKSSGEYGPILAELVSVGQDIHAAVLHGIDEDARQQKRADKFRAWFDQNVVHGPLDAWRIEVVHGRFADFITPWALAYAPVKGAKGERDPKNPDDYSGFWGIRFKVAVRGETDEAPEAESNKREGERFKLACVLEISESVVTQVESTVIRDREKIAKAGAKKTQKHETSDMHKHIAWSRPGYKGLAGQFRRWELFWYIALNPEGGAYRLLKPSDIQENFDSSNATTDRVVLMLIDGNAIVRHERGAEWVQSALEVGRAGLIAVETNIRNDKLRFFGWTVLRSLLESKLPLLDGMAKVRREYWPLGLLYGIYCNPVHAEVLPPFEDMIEDVDAWMSTVRKVTLGGDRP